MLFLRGSMAEIRFEQVTKIFGRAAVIKKLDLTIRGGEFFTFVGPSGCGKSTLLNMIAGLEDVTSGSLLFDGIRVNEFSPRDRDVAMVFQSYALYPHMTVFENIAFPLAMKKERPHVVDAEVKRIARLLGLEELLSRRPKELSGGQRQRVALGRAIIRKPKVFLMDEPLSNLDARLRIEMRAELKLLHQTLGITTIYVTHDQGEAMGLSDRIAVLHNGEIQQCDTPGRVYRYPANVFVAGFIGSPPMNFLRCIVLKRKPLEVDCNGLVLSKPVSHEPAANEVLIGMRPEDVRIERERQDESVEVIVSVIEPAGSFNWVEVLWKDARIRGLSKPEESFQPGQSAYLTFSRDKVSVFDPPSGKRL